MSWTYTKSYTTKECKSQVSVKWVNNDRFISVSRTTNTHEEYIQDEIEVKMRCRQGRARCSCCIRKHYYFVLLATLADFFGRPRFFAELLLLVVVFGLEAAALLTAELEGRPRFFAGDALLAGGAVFFDDDRDGRPRFLLAPPSPSSFDGGLATGAAGA